jgi:UDP-perosamine 4-acetyltransferase
VADQTGGNQVRTIVGVGAGGHVKSVIDAVQSTALWNIVGLVDVNSEIWGTRTMGCVILGGDRELPGLLANGVNHAFIGVGGVADNAPRIGVFRQLVELGFSLPPICHRTSTVSQSATIQRGSVILAGAIIGADTCVGENVIVNTGAIIDHDCRIGSHSHISTAARLAGMVRVGEGSHVGIGATVRQGVTIGDYAVVGAGSVVLRDVAPGATVVGVPAGLLKHRPNRIGS